MKEGKYRLIGKEDLYEAGVMWRLQIEAPGIEARPGQFVNIAVSGKYLRRPISVCDYDGEVLSLVVRPVGEGTLRLIATPVGARLDMLTGLGNGFSLPTAPGRGVALLIGGGVGYAPLVGLMRMVAAKSDLHPFAVFGFNTEAEVPLKHIQELREEGFTVEYCTMTGEMGDRGNALEVAMEHMDHYGIDPACFYTCGPGKMMEAVAQEMECDGELCLEARMGCGYGACMGCSIRTASGPRRICKDGPVFKKSELIL